MKNIFRTRLPTWYVLGLLAGLTLLSARWLSDPADSIVDRLTNYIANYWQEKVYLHFDKPYYSTGETIWFKSYLVNAVTHRPEPRSGLLYADLIDPNGQVIAQRRLKVVDGGAAGDFALPDSVSGTYRVRAYTQWMRNFDAGYFFTQSFPVWSTDSTAIGQTIQQESRVEDKSFVYEGQRSLIDLQFFPEGGELTDGLTSLVAFKAVGPDGKSMEVTGEVVNQNREAVTTFKTHHQGMGAFILKPMVGETYIAQVELEGVPLEFPLPEVRPQGYALRVSHTGSHDEVKVTVHATPGLEAGGGTLVAHRRGLVFAAFEVPEGDSILVADLAKSVFPSGICHLTFFDATGNPHCERLLYPHLPSLPMAIIERPSSPFAPRQRVALPIALRDTSGQRISGRASLTVTNPREVVYESYTDDIRSYLLFSSDLKGFIEQPTYYLEDTSAAGYRARDYLMLTQGWRRFRWSDVLSDSVATFPYLAEQGFTVGGRLVNYYQREKPAPGTISMIMMNQAFVSEGDTDSLGRFAFVDNQFEDSIEVILQARRKVGKKEKLRQDVAILLDEPAPLPFTPVLRPRITPTLAMMNEYLNRRRQINQVDSAYDFDNDVIVLEGVEVKGRRDQRNDPFYRASQLYGEPSHRLVMDSIAGTESAMSVFDLLYRVPGVRVVGTFPNQTAFIRGMSSINGSNEALFLVDGIPGDAEMVNSISVRDVYYVDVLKGPSAAMYGSQGANGAVAVYTRRGSNATPRGGRQGIINFTHPGYSATREFYAPRYDTQKPEHVKPDLRSTLFWEPNIVFDESGQATVSLYTSDQPGTYEVRLEGLTQQGEPIVGRASFVVKK